MKNLIELLRNTLHLNVHSINKTLDYSKPIPFIIKKSFEISVIKIENLECVVLSVDEEEIKSIKKHLAIFKKSLSQPIIINVNYISTSTRKYLIENGISFVSQEAVYLPQLLVYFENFSNKPKSKKKKLSKLAQVILISELIQNQNNINFHSEINISDSAKKFNVTNMSTSRALKELYEFGYLDLNKEVRKKIYRLKQNISLKDLINTLKNPKMDVIYIQKEDLKYVDSKTLSSYNALSHYTNISSSSSTYAVEKDYFSKYLNKNNQIRTYEKQYDNDLIEIELWTYSPNLIQKNVVDPISLYLLLKNNANSEDTRLNNAIEELYNKIEGMIVGSGNS